MILIFKFSYAKICFIEIYLKGIKNMNINIVLASASPRRKELLKLITSEFDIIPSDVDETLPEEIKSENAAEYLAKIKARSIGNIENTAVIGCDTVVVIDGNILGKPKNREQCRSMLTSLSGKTHFVYTGVCIIYNSIEYSFTEKTEVIFYNLSEMEIEEYIETGEPFDKAGGYGIQGKGALLVKGINGDYFNVVGLPVSTLNRKLKEIISH